MYVLVKNEIEDKHILEPFYIKTESNKTDRIIFLAKDSNDNYESAVSYAKKYNYHLTYVTFAKDIIPITADFVITISIDMELYNSSLLYDILVFCRNMSLEKHIGNISYSNRDCKDIAEHDKLIMYLKNDYELSAWRGHYELATWLVKTFNPLVTVDLGVDYGHSTFALSYNNNGYVYGIDCFEGDSLAGYRDTFKLFTDTHNKLISDGLLRKNIVLIKGYFNSVEKIFNQTIDLLHIDGMHDYQSVKNDFTLWSKKVKDDGIIIIHDIVSFEDVKKVFNEIPWPKTQMLNSAGLGILCRNQKIIDKINDLWVNKIVHKNDHMFHTDLGFKISLY